MGAPNTTCVRVFLACNAAVREGKRVLRTSRREKEFILQDWFAQRLNEAGLKYDSPARNKYPDFTLVHFSEGYEVKGLEFPGREADFDANSQVPSGLHNGRVIFYVFGRYPAYREGETEYPLTDLVICHGDFLNVDHEYVHENKSFRGFGSYGDILVRDRKMYVVPTPFGLLDGVAGQMTLIVPEDMELGEDSEELECVGNLVRAEAEELIIAYSFDLRTNELSVKKVPNPSAGLQHCFKAYRVKGAGGDAVTIKAAKREDLPELDPAHAQEELA